METKKYLFDGRIYLSELKYIPTALLKADWFTSIECVNDNPPGVKTCEDFEGNIGTYAIGLVEVKPQEFYYQKAVWCKKLLKDKIDNKDFNIENELNDIFVYFRKSLSV